MTCPHCGARNTADAPWCTQCLRPLEQDPPPPAPDEPTSTVASSPAPGGAHPVPGHDADAAFRSVDGQVQWRCPACDTWNRLEEPACTTCGSRLAASVTGARAADVIGRVPRARRILWVVAAIGAMVAVVSVVLLFLAVRGGVAA